MQAGGPLDFEHVSQWLARLSRNNNSNNNSPQALTTTMATTLRPALSTNHMALNNSLVLEPTAWECFNYIPSSMLVYNVGKPFTWSMFAYVHSTIASWEPGVMSGFIAVASVERASLLHQQTAKNNRDSMTAQQRQLRRLGMTQYRLALKELSSVVDRATSGDRTPANLDALFALWYLVLIFESYHADLTAVSHVHLNGIRSFLSRFVNNGQGPGSAVLPPASQQLLLFTLSV